jgi:hypothetical protein
VSSSTAQPAAETAAETIEVRVSELKDLFNSMDASPFRHRDLDPAAEEFIVGWANDAPRGRALTLLIDLDRAAPPLELFDERAILSDAIHDFFAQRASVVRSRLRQLLRTGRISLLVGLSFLIAAVVSSDLVATALKGQRAGELLREGLVIIGWVAMWRPVEIFLYGWWPLRTQANLYDRLSAMPVKIAYKESSHDGSREAWRRDWPALPQPVASQQKTPPRVPPPAASDGTPLGAVPPHLQDVLVADANSGARPARQTPGV